MAQNAVDARAGAVGSPLSWCPVMEIQLINDFLAVFISTKRPDLDSGKLAKSKTFRG